MLNYNLLTKYGESLDENNVLKEYPRPQFRRDSYFNLNGIWKYEINKSGNIDGVFKNKILVPFPIESVLSKVRKELKDDEYLIYKLDFDLPNKFIRENTFINFDGVDQKCKVILNNKELGEHIGGYLPFSFNINKIIKEKNNKLFVIVKDETSVLYPTGKQCKKRGGIFYTPTSGIWKSVWLESTGIEIIKDIKITPDIDNEIINLMINSDANDFEIIIKDKNKIITKLNTNKRNVSIKINNPILWDNNNPHLYDLEISTKDDKIYSYFAMRKIEIKNNKIYFNNKPFFINGVLDQGYFSDGIYTPASYDAYKDDILTMKQFGFNTLRKHIKIEPMYFYYLCDKYGMLVMQDMVNIGKISKFFQNIVPAKLGFLHAPIYSLNKSQRKFFIKHSIDTINYLYNVPSIVYYTIFNEGWGEFHPDKVYKILKPLDNTRIFDATSGWFIRKLSDVYSYHIYNKPIVINPMNRPIIVSEFGAYCYRESPHCFLDENTSNTGYNMMKDKTDLENKFINVYEKEIIPNIKNGLCGVIYTQLSDVEDEVNGILTYDRKICKFNKDKIKNIISKIKLD